MFDVATPAAAEEAPAVVRSRRRLLARQARALLRVLTPRQRQTFVLRVSRGLSFRTCAAILGCAEHTTKKTFARARRRLERVLSGSM